MTSVPERDWTLFKIFHPIALERFSKRILDQVQTLLKNNTTDCHQIYLALHKLIKERDKEIAQVFNDYRRSTAFFQIAMMYNRGLLTDQEFMQFSDETRGRTAGMNEVFRRNESE